jgi:hypothetical protein
VPDILPYISLERYGLPGRHADTPKKAVSEMNSSRLARSQGQISSDIIHRKAMKDCEAKLAAAEAASFDAQRRVCSVRGFQFISSECMCQTESSLLVV